MTAYETLGGTEADMDEQHEARTVRRTNDDDTQYMMTEIGDGTFVQWSTCAKCGLQVRECHCSNGPKEPDYIERWRVNRFTDSFAGRGALPALPPLLRHQDRRINAVVRLLRSQGWTVESPGPTTPGGSPVGTYTKDAIIDPDDVSGESDDPDYGGHVEAIDSGLDSALERLKNAKEGTDDVGF